MKLRNESGYLSFDICYPSTTSKISIKLSKTTIINIIIGFICIDNLFIDHLHLRGDLSIVNCQSKSNNKRCIAAARLVQCAAISSSQCQSSNVTQPSHLHVVTSHGAEPRRPAKVSCRHLAAGVKRSRRKTVSRRSMHYAWCQYITATPQISC